MKSHQLRVVFAKTDSHGLDLNSVDYVHMLQGATIHCITSIEVTQ